MRSFEWFVGLRYLSHSKKRKTLLSLTTLISLGGIAMGVMALIVVISVMNGFGKDIQSKILGFKSHIVIEAKNFLPFEPPADFLLRVKQSDSRITEVTPYVLTEMMIRHGGALTGVLLKGIPHMGMRTPEVLDLEKKWHVIPPLLVGRELAYTLSVEEGDVVEIISPIETTGPLGTIPKMKKYRVGGFLTTGLYEYDTKLVYVTLTEAQYFLEYGKNLSGIEVKVSEIYETDQIIERIKSLPFAETLEIRDWRVLNKNLFSALRLEKIAMFVILSFIVLVAALNIITTVTKSVLDKKKEIAILKAIGARSKQILVIFLLDGICIGIAGIFLGSLGGWGICAILDRYKLIRLPEIYYFTTVPVEMQLSQCVAIGGIAFLITGLCSLYPAWKASKLDPLDGIRY